MIGRRRNTSLIAITVGAVLLASLPVAAQVSSPVGTYTRTFSGASGYVDQTLQLNPDNTATLTSVYEGQMQPVVQTGVWTSRYSYATSGNWVYVTLTDTAGGPVRDTIVFDQRRNWLAAHNWDRGVHGSGPPTFVRTTSVPAQIGAGPAVASISGTINYRERIALTPSAVVTVELADVSQPDTRVLGSQVITNPGQPPIPFTINYDPRAINSARTYVVRAQIRDQGRLMFMNSTAYPVITQNNPTEVTIWMVQP